jgi:hypothetical protein
VTENTAGSHRQAGNKKDWTSCKIGRSRREGHDMTEVLPLTTLTYLAGDVECVLHTLGGIESEQGMALIELCSRMIKLTWFSRFGGIGAREAS